MSTERPGLLFVLWEEVYRLLHWRQWRAHMDHLKAQEGEKK